MIHGIFVERIWKEIVMMKSKVLYWHLLEGTEENYGNLDQIIF
jgi:hypothetical protein